MSDKVIFKGQVYGNTVATKMTTVLEEPAPIDDDGTYIYVIDKGTDTETVEIADGGRVTFGATDLDTIILNGIKMKKGITDIETAFSQGKIKPTDLYTAFNLPMCFTRRPDTWTVNDIPWDGTYPVIGEDYSLVGVHSVGNYIYIVTMANDLPKNLNDKIYQQDGLIA